MRLISWTLRSGSEQVLFRMESTFFWHCPEGSAVDPSPNSNGSTSSCRDGPFKEKNNKKGPSSSFIPTTCLTPGYRFNKIFAIKTRKYFFFGMACATVDCWSVVVSGMGPRGWPAVFINVVTSAQWLQNYIVRCQSLVLKLKVHLHEIFDLIFFSSIHLGSCFIT